MTLGPLFQQQRSATLDQPVAPGPSEPADARPSMRGVHGIRTEPSTVRMFGRMVPVEALFVGDLRVGRVREMESGLWRWSLEWDAAGDGTTRLHAIWLARKELERMFGEALVSRPPNR